MSLTIRRNSEEREARETGETDTLLSSEPKGNSVATSFFLIFAYIIGSAFLTQSYIFREAGVAIAPLLYFFAMAASYMGSTTLLDIMGVHQNYDYATVAGDLLGTAGWVAVHVTNIASTIGYLLSYFVLLGSMLQDIIRAFGGGDSAWYTDLFFLTASCVIFLVPLTVYRQFADMFWLSVITTGFLFTAFMYIMIEGSFKASDYDTDSIEVASGTGIIKSIGFVMFGAAGASMIVPATYKNAATDDRISFDSVLYNSIVLGAMFLFTTGLAEYLIFRHLTQVDILFSFDGTTGAVLKMIVLGYLGTYIPGLTVTGRNSVFAVLGINPKEENILSLLGVSGLLLTVTGFIACILAEEYSYSSVLSNTINITGGVAAPLLSYGLPGLLALRCEAVSSNTSSMITAVGLLLCNAVTILMVLISFGYES
jgi:amino acid permease